MSHYVTTWAVVVACIPLLSAAAADHVQCVGAEERDETILLQIERNIVFGTARTEPQHRQGTMSRAAHATGGVRERSIYRHAFSEDRSTVHSSRRAAISALEMDNGPVTTSPAIAIFNSGNVPQSLGPATTTPTGVMVPLVANSATALQGATTPAVGAAALSKDKQGNAGSAAAVSITTQGSAGAALPNAMQTSPGMSSPVIGTITSTPASRMASLYFPSPVTVSIGEAATSTPAALFFDPPGNNVEGLEKVMGGIQTITTTPAINVFFSESGGTTSPEPAFFAGMQPAATSTTTPVALPNQPALNILPQWGAATTTPPTFISVDAGGVGVGPVATSTTTPEIVPYRPYPLNETLQEVDAEMLLTTTTQPVTTTTFTFGSNADEEAADAMVKHAAAQLKAFNSERVAAAKTAVWLASQVAANATAAAAADEKDSIQKGMDAIKKTKQAAKKDMNTAMAMTALNYQPGPQTADLLGPQLGVPMPAQPPSPSR